MGSHLYGVASLNVEEMGWSGLLGLGKNLGIHNMILTTFLRCLGKCMYLGVVFSYFGALMGASGVTYVWRGFPECGGDGMEWPIGSG